MAENDTVIQQMEALSGSWPRVVGRCPACKSTTLFLGSGGYVTCSLIGCPDPTAASDLLEAHGGK